MLTRVSRKLGGAGILLMDFDSDLGLRLMNFLFGKYAFL